MKRIISYFAAALLLFAATSCIDEKIYDDTVIGEGEATLSAEVLFKNFTPALDGSRATEGDALDGIYNLYLFVYNENGTELLYSPSFQKGVGEGDIKVTNENTTLPSDGTYNPSAETPTDRGTFNFKLPFGKYKIYAVANVRGENVEKLKPGNVSNETALKSVKFKWNQTTISDNDQMFGVFTTGALGDSPAAVYNAPVVTINQTQVTLRAWLRRLASKVTVAFDGSGLKDNVRIYIKSVRIKDIPEYCTLGASNTPGENDPLIPDGGMINYTTDDPNDPNVNWASHTAGLRVLKNSKEGSTQHLHDDANSLFFYENDQGTGKSKQQDADEDGKLDYPDGNDPSKDGWKDNKPYGTYIEVEAYYTSENEEKMSQGKITYRFMLGKNVTDNYDAERNYHYKLTLKFINWANNPDWHIVYKEPTPTVYTPEIYYISYLYNRQMNFPVRVYTGDGESAKDYTLRAEIIADNWGPSADDPEQEDTSYGDVPNAWVPGGDAPLQDDVANLNGFAWNEDVFYGNNGKNNPYTSSKVKIMGDKEINAGANFVGFLTLRRNTATIIGDGIDYRSAEAPAFLKSFYEGNEEGVTPRWWAEYNLEKDGYVCGNQTDGEYTVKYNEEDGSVTASVPMFTRAKELVPTTDFTGNNPFESYMRVAFVKFTLYKTTDPDKTPIPFIDTDNPDGEKITERIVPIFQVRRIVNPKAIWRKSGNLAPFYVELKHRVNEASTDYSDVVSRGPWRAYILRDPKRMVTLTGDDGKMVKSVPDFDSYGEPVGDAMITGGDGDPIKFTYTPSGPDGCAIIRVDYHNYSCHHLIFVRTGYDYPVRLGQADWSCYSAYAASGISTNLTPSNGVDGTAPNNVPGNTVRVELTKNPLSIGTFFKRNNYTYGFLESNNENDGWLVAPGPLRYVYIDPATNTLSNDPSQTISWGNVWGHAWSNQGGYWNRTDYKWADTWKPIDDNKPDLAVPTYEDYASLIDVNASPNIEFGYGIAYGDGATGVATNINDAYGFTDYDNTGNGSAKGMRVCVVYDKSNGDQILFPISSIGQGRRARTTTSDGQVPAVAGASNRPGALSYSGMTAPLSSVTNGLRPLSYNIYRQSGVLYWIRQPYKWGSGVSDWCASWDINYRNFVFNHYSNVSLQANGSPNKSNCSDALPIRFIYKKN